MSSPTVRTPRRQPFEFADQLVPAGRRERIELPIARLMSGTPVALPVIIVHGKSAGPTIWINAAIHGDEIGGVDIIRRVLDGLDPKTMAGTVIAVPIVNVHGFNNSDRYLPDRRDLNRSFPGSRRGSLAARIANLFAAPVTIHARTRDGSLRQAATEAGATVLLYEAGEALRFDRGAIRVGTNGVRRILRHVGITDDAPDPPAPTAFSRATKWARATRSGILHLEPDLGDDVERGAWVASVVDPFGKRLSRISAPATGIVIGHTQHPLVNRGDAVLHVATTT